MIKERESLRTEEGLERLRVQKHKGTAVLICDFNASTREEAGQLLQDLVETISLEAEGSVRLYISAEGASRDASHATEWKRHLPLFNSRLKRSAVTGLSPLNRMALAGVRMYARLVGQDRAPPQTKVFESRSEALDYLAAEK